MMSNQRLNWGFGLGTENLKMITYIILKDYVEFGKDVQNNSHFHYLSWVRFHEEAKNQ